MSDISHGDWCDLPLDEDGECAVCNERKAKETAYYGALFANQPRYTRADIEDVYSDPTDSHKREVMLNEMGF